MIPRTIDHDFAMWAFGDRWLDFLTYDCNPLDLMKAWNKKNGRLLKLDGKGSILDDMNKMKELWEECNDRI
jgi:hypothetical protein